MPKMNVNESIMIDAPKEKVYEIVSDFHHWQAWSPWLIMEPGVNVAVANDGKYYEWEGDIVGSGNMTVLEEKENERINYDLKFLKPWKSQADVSFSLEESGEGTKVTWTMNSSLPFFMFWMKKMMEAMVAGDYNRGLLMLKDYIEKGHVESILSFKGEQQFSGHQYIGIKTETNKAGLDTKMSEDFKQLWAYLSDKGDLVTDKAFSIYHKWDMVKDNIVYTSGFPVDKIPDDLPEGFTTGQLPQTKANSVVHEGPYKHLGNAWSAMYNRSRGKGFKMNKKVDPFEVYLNDPDEVAENELLTEVYFPVK